MYQIGYMQEFIKKHNPALPFRYELLEEGRYLMEIDRAEKTKAKANERRREEKDKKKIVQVLDKESRDEKVTNARHKQLTEMKDELRELHHYIKMAQNAKLLVAQLKLEDIEIDRRVEKAKKDAQEARERIRELEERDKQAELKVKREGKEHRLYLMAQMQENDARRLERKKKILQDGIEMKKYMAKLEEKHRQELEVARIAKEKCREETMEFIRQKIEFQKQQKIDDTNQILQHYEMERKRDAMQQAIVDARNRRIEDQLRLGAKIGEKVWAINNAKEQSLINLIETFAVEHENRCDLLEEKEQESLIEKRRLMQGSMRIQMEEKHEKKQKEILRTEELMKKRLTSSHHDSEMSLLRKRMERENWENEQFLQVKALERKELAQKELEADRKGINSVYVTEERERQEIEAVRIKTLEEQPISVLRYLPSSLLRRNYLPKPIADRVKEQVKRDPIPVFNIKRNLRYVKRIKAEGGDLVMCCKTCPPPKPISNIF